jgi:o-succinylbenzoate synthase
MRIVAVAARIVRWPIAGTGAARGRSERAAVLVEVRSERGAIGLGEAAPLPGMSTDTLAEVEPAIAAFARRAPIDVAGGDAARTLVAAAPPAVRFALETALLDALGREHRVSLAALLCVPAGAAPAAHAGADRRAPLAAVVDDPAAARRAFAAGIRCFKIKLFADDPVDRVFAIAAVTPGARLRIDANRSWPHRDVVGRLAALASLPIEYVEEPCRDAHRLLAGPLPCRLALDESLPELGPDDLVAALRSPQLAAVILKPTVLGGVSAAVALARLARSFGVAAVASHALEGPIGTAACAELALALAGDPGAGASATTAPLLAAGLAPHAALAGWRLEVPQLAADHVRAAAGPGLGFADLDLAAAVRACPAAVTDGAGAP